MLKAARLIATLNCVKALEKTTPELVAVRLGGQLGKDLNDSNFRRNVYRDLRELADSGYLQAKYFDTSGKEILEWDDETSRNQRVEYSIFGNEFGFIGQGILKKYGFDFHPPSRRSMAWIASDLLDGLPEASLNILFQAQPGKWIGLHLAQSELPFRLVCARGEPIDPSQLKLFQENFGVRAGLLLTSDISMSRIQPPSKWGQCVFGTNSNGNQLEIKSLKESSDVKVEQFSMQEIEKIVEQSSTQKTINSSSVFETSLNSSAPNLGTKPVSLDLPLRIQCGQLQFLVCQTST